MRDHLTKAQSWDGMTALQLKRRRENQEIAAVLWRLAPSEGKRLEVKRAELLKIFIDKETLEYLNICYTVNANVSFSQVKHPDFQIILQYINPAANNVLFSSHNTIRSWVMNLYSEGKRRIFFMLQAGISSIHITCDT